MPPFALISSAAMRLAALAPIPASPCNVDTTPHLMGGWSAANPDNVNVKSKAAIETKATTDLLSLFMFHSPFSLITNSSFVELIAVGLLLRIKSSRQLLRFLGFEVIACQEIRGNSGKTYDAGMFCSKRGLYRPNGLRPALDKLLTPLVDFCFKLLRGHDDIYEPHRERLLGRVFSAKHPYFFCLLLADVVLHVPCPVAGIEASHHGSDLPEYGTIGRDREIAYHLKNVPASDRITIHRCDDRLRKLVNDVIHVHGGLSPFIGVGFDSFYLLSSYTKELSSGAGDDNYSCVLILSRRFQGTPDFDHGLRPEHVAAIRSIDRDSSNIVFPREQDIFVFHRLLLLTNEPPKARYEFFLSSSHLMTPDLLSSLNASGPKPSHSL